MCQNQSEQARYAHDPTGLVGKEKEVLNPLILTHQRGAQQGEAAAKIKIDTLDNSYLLTSTKCN